MLIVGVDLSGPSNSADTAAAWFRPKEDEMHWQNIVSGADDKVIYTQAQELATKDDLAIGLDAPLSYNDGGGDRPRDAELRKLVVEAGLRSGSVMTPTKPGMAYLTLRGLAVSRFLLSVDVPTEMRIVEIHPRAFMALNGAPIAAVRDYRDSKSSREKLIRWMESQGVRGIDSVVSLSDHSLDACVAALATWRWMRGDSRWVARADLPHHPFDFAC